MPPPTPMPALVKSTGASASGTKVSSPSAIIDKYPAYPGFDETLARQFELAVMLKDGARGKILLVIYGFKNYDKARVLQQVYDNAPIVKLLLWH